MKVRLQKFLAEAGLGSRRGCEDLIRAGRVTVDGRVATLGESVEPAAQAVLVDGRPVAAEVKEYWLLNKPLGVLSAAVDARGRQTVTDCVPTPTGCGWSMDCPASAVWLKVQDAMKDTLKATTLEDLVSTPRRNGRVSGSKGGSGPRIAAASAGFRAE